MRRARAIIASLVAVVAASSASAQLAPGYSPPTSLASGIEDVQGDACFLASAGRPFPGITGPLLGMDGEGLKVETVAPDWLTADRPATAGVRYATLATAEGPIWIVYDAARHSCLVAAKPADALALNDLVTTRLEGDADWKRANTTDASQSWYRTIKGSSLRWETRVWITPAPQSALMVETLATVQ